MRPNICRRILQGVSRVRVHKLTYLLAPQHNKQSRINCIDNILRLHCTLEPIFSISSGRQHITTLRPLPHRDGHDREDPRASRVKLRSGICRNLVFTPRVVDSSRKFPGCPPLFQVGKKNALRLEDLVSQNSTYCSPPHPLPPATPT